MLAEAVVVEKAMKVNNQMNAMTESMKRQWVMDHLCTIRRDEEITRNPLRL